nr:hypothetical protein [Tanacetum cinerariifolium]
MKIIIFQSDETPSSHDATNENIAKFKVAAKSKGSTSKLEKVKTHKVATQKVQTKPFPAKTLVPIRNCILGLAAAHTWACIGNKTFGIEKPKDAIVANQDTKGKMKNDAFHLLEIKNMHLNLYKLNIEDHDHPIITTIEIPHGLHRGRNFVQSFGGSIGSDNSTLVLIDIPSLLHLQGRLFESHGCLLLVCRDDVGSRKFTIYEMMKGCYVWMVMYLVNTNEFMTPLPE